MHNSHTEYLERNRSTQFQQIHNPHPPMSNTSQSKYLHIVYWAIIALLIWGITDLYTEQQRILQLAQKRKVSEQGQKQLISGLQQEIQKQKQIYEDKHSLVESSLRSTELKTTQIHKAAMEEQHLRKIQYIKDRSRQTWGIVRDSEKAKVSLLLATSNFQFQTQNIHLKQEIDDLLQTQYKRLSKEYNFSLPQKSFCVVVPTINNSQKFRNIYNLRSILRQNYTNYKVVILDDASTDQNYEVLRQYIKEHKVRQTINITRNSKKSGALYNIHKAATKYCSPDDILLIVDGDDELLGVNVFKTFNSVYTTKNLQVAYSNFIVLYHKKHELRGGWSSAYSEQEKRKNIYRDQSTRMFPVRTFKVSTFLKIDQKNFKYDNGDWFQTGSDQTYCPQVLQLSCGKNDYIDEYFYLVNKQLGSNDMDIDPNKNYGVMNIVRARKKYQCPK